LTEGNAGSVQAQQGMDMGTHPDSQEAVWVAASQRGDALAFNRLVLKWERSIYNLALRMLQDPEEAAEMAQEVFMTAYQNIRKFRQDAKFSTWIYRIAVNRCISRMRKRPPGIHYSLDDRDSRVDVRRELSSAHSHEGDLLRRERRSQVQQALRALSPEQKTVVELKFFQDLTFEEISAVVQVPLSTVKSRLYAGLESLKLRLGTLGVPGGMEA
jgi:RNA polymerase sigma-70 factor (ECF subfamily)